MRFLISAGFCSFNCAPLSYFINILIFQAIMEPTSKFTLCFLDPELEKAYQKNSYSVAQRKVIRVFSVAGFIVTCVDCVQYYEIQQFDRMFLMVAVAFYFLGQFIWFWKTIKFVNIGLLMTNFLIMVPTVNLMPTLDVFFGFLHGSNEMLAHTIIFFVQSFRYGSLATITLSVLRCLLAYYKSPVSIGAEQYLYTAGVTLFFIYVSYEIEKNKRNAFSLNVRDTLKEMMIEQLVSKPFYIFKMDPISNQLIVMKQKTGKELPSLNEFIMTCQLKSRTLKDIIYQKIKEFYNSDSDFAQHSFTVRYIRSKFKIKFCQYFAGYSAYSIAVESLEENCIALQSAHTATIRKIKNQIKRALLQIQQQIYVAVSQKSFIELALTRLQVIALLSKLSLNIEVLEKVSVAKVFASLVPDEQKQLVDFKILSDLVVVTNKQLFLYFCAQLLLACFLQKKVKINLLRVKDRQIISVSGLISLPKRGLFKRTCKVLFQKVTKPGDNTFYFIFNQEPAIRYFLLHDSQ